MLFPGAMKMPMKTTKAIFGVLTDRTSQTFATTEPVSGRRPVVALLTRLLWAAALALPVFGTQAAAVLTTLYSFTGGNDGRSPDGLVQGSDGYLYGTTSGGGTNNNGTVFKISANGAFTTLYSFGGNDGAGPGGLVQGSDGNFYGTTSGGGITNFNVDVGLFYGCGTVFKISANGGLTSLYSFTGGNDGAGPGGLVQGSDGNFYGTAGWGGTNNYGTVFKINTNGALTSLYSFSGGNDGAFPQAALAQGSDGNFYGTTSSGGTTNYNVSLGTYGYGTVFKISPNGATSLYPSLVAMMAGIPAGWWRAATAISMARLEAAATPISTGVMVLAPCSKSAPLGR